MTGFPTAPLPSFGQVFLTLRLLLEMWDGEDDCVGPATCLRYNRLRLLALESSARHLTPSGRVGRTADTPNGSQRDALVEPERSPR
jgi:hypothetical protein